ncbi:cyclic nucleotide dependent protein kinase [Monoraphidium neglectum]|uniref:Cyclic nucleotide dependent protein kinase n=1 Tax=Monoraphidium neglectum TaxID=145388 RepID=A0A0D2ITU3_9CHLO|nr:cyclic nucleotide dependent protein kinase [Monoraphidium neglectum]KIY91427.1 cyclic nucleotide dependent protein kinase [Monoraphidium neglectum]|eukprot:XP_013890447.1 cyclic nucleotide dependent protein kinase [Monoraphidium neglectum]
MATVQAHTKLTCLALAREEFVQLLGPLQKLMEREKSPQARGRQTGGLGVIAQRLSKLATFKRHGASHGRQPAEVLIKRRKRGRNGETAWEVVRARGHLDEVQELRRGGSKLEELANYRPPSGGGGRPDDGGGVDHNAAPSLTLTEGAVLGGGAFSRVSVVTEDSTGRSYAMKRMRKSAVVQCPEHVFCEQAGMA